MDKRYKEFADDFENLCGKYAIDDFDAGELMAVCKGVIDNYSN